MPLVTIARAQNMLAVRQLLEGTQDRDNYTSLWCIEFSENSASTDLLKRLPESTQKATTIHSLPVFCSFGCNDSQIGIASHIAVKWRWYWLHQLGKDIQRCGQLATGENFAGHAESPLCLSAIGQEAGFPQQTQACRLRLYLGSLDVV